jgi:uncharacterized membrane protein YeaQ/YmgE (transglycosylase-associated protein family)
VDACYACVSQAIRERTPEAKEGDMDIQTLLIWIIVGAVAGFLAGTLVRGYGLGLIGNVIVGILGAFIAGWLLPRVGVAFVIGNSAILTSIVYATIGAVILLLLVGLVRRSA